MARAKTGTRKTTVVGPTVGDVVAGLAAAEEWLRLLRRALKTVDQDLPLGLPSMPTFQPPIHAGRNC
jgi:hypothetical protein